MEKGTIGDTLTIENQFTKLSARELRSLSIEQLAAYRKCERANSLSTPPQRGKLALRKILHPLLMGVLYIYHIAKGIRIKTNGSVPKTDRPIIFSVSHIGLYDVEVILQTIKKHVYILSGDEEAMYRTFDGWYFDTNGGNLCRSRGPSRQKDSAEHRCKIPQARAISHVVSGGHLEFEPQLCDPSDPLWDH